MSQIQTIERQVILNGRTHNQCWFAPSVAVVPPRVSGGHPEVHVSAWQLTANDTGNQHWVHTHDMGRRWSPPMESQNLLGIPREDHTFEKPGLTPFYHRASDRLMALGSTYFTRDQGTETSFKMEHWCESPRDRSMCYTEWDFGIEDFAPWQAVEMPESLKQFHVVGWVKVDIELDDGSLLCPMYFRATPETKYYAVCVMRAELDGGALRCIEMGAPLVLDTHRGLCEPSIVRFQDRYYMTIRHDVTAYLAVSDDGLNYGEPAEWCFDTGPPLGNYNTQQHWLRHGDTLYLVYNRRSEHSNGVFRDRAPLFIAQLDTERRCVVRATEQIVFPENGARMGNFGVANITDDEAWVITGEWLEGMVQGMKEGDRFYFLQSAPHFNRLQYLGDLLLARVRF